MTGWGGEGHAGRHRARREPCRPALQINGFALAQTLPLHQVVTAASGVSFGSDNHLERSSLTSI